MFILHNASLLSFTFYYGEMHRLTFFPAAPSGARPQAPGTGLIQPHEIAAALPKEGISIGNLMKLFASRVGDLTGQQTSKKEFIKLVKENSSYGPDKLLRPKS
jgi:transcription initiation factor TFIIF subunit alpha